MQNVIYYRHAFNRYSTNLQKTRVTINETLNRKKGKRDFPKKIKLTNGNTISEKKKLQMLLMISSLASETPVY